MEDDWLGLEGGSPVTAEDDWLGLESPAELVSAKPGAADMPADDDNTWSDVGRAIASGAMSVGSGAGWLAQKYGELTDSPMVAAFGSFLKDKSNQDADSLHKGMSEYIKAVNEKPFLKDRSDWRDPESMKQFISWGDLTPGEALDKIQMMVYESAPGTAAGMGAGAGIAGGLKMLPGVGKKLAAMLGYGSGEALIAAPMSGAQAEKEVLDMPEEDLAKHVEYQAMMIEGVPPEDARKTMAKAAGGDAAAMTAASTFFLSSPFGEALDKVMGGESASMLMGAGKGALTEGIQETLQSGAEQASINAAVQANADPGRSLAEGVPEAMVGGLGAGAAMGAGFGAVAGRSEGLRQREQLEREREIDARAERAAREAEARGGDTLDQLIAKQQVYWSEDVPQDPAGMPTNADVPPGPSDGPGSPVTYNPYQEQMQPLHSVPYETTGPGGQEMRPLTPEDAIPYQRPDMPEAGGLSLAPMDAASPPGNGIDFSNNESRILDEKAGAIERATEEYGRQNELNSLLSIAPADREPVVEPSDYTPSIPALQEEHDRQRAEIQAQVNQAAKALADQNRIKKTEIPEIDREILHAIAAAGGLDREEARAQGIDPAEFGRRVGGLSPVFRASGGKSFDEMAEYLSQLGFFGDQEYSANALLDKISTSLSGTPVYSPSSNFAVERAAREEELDQLQAALDQFEQDILEDADEPPKGRLFNEAADSERRLAYAMLEAELAGVPEPEIDRIVFNHSVPDEEAERALREAIDNEKRKRRPEGQGAPGAAARDNQGDQAAPRGQGAAQEVGGQEAATGEVTQIGLTDQVGTSDQIGLADQEGATAGLEGAAGQKNADQVGALDQVGTTAQIGTNEVEPDGQGTMFGATPTGQQSLADLQREKDKKRNGTKDVPADVDGGLLSNQSQQTDIEEATNAESAAPSGSQAEGAVSRPIFTGKSAFSEGQYGASSGNFSEGTRRQLMVDPDGGYYWGDWRQESERDVGPVIGGKDKDGTPAYFPTSKEARAAAESTPQNKTAPAAEAATAEGGPSPAARKPGSYFSGADIDGAGEPKSATAGADSSAIDAAANEAATSPLNDRPDPTPGQIEAGNYKKGDPFTLHGHRIVIENPKGSTRSGTDKDGKTWSNTMGAHYGDIKGTVAADGDNLDVFVGQNPESERIFIIDQQKQNGDKGGFDEHKVLVAFADQASAEKAYLDSYAKGWGIGPVSELTPEQFKEWIANGDHTKPYGKQVVKQKNDRPADPLQDKVDSLDAEIDAAAAELAELLKPKPGTLNTGVDPQVLIVGAKLGALYVQKGIVKFSQWSKAIIAKLREMGVEPDSIKPYLKEIYAATQQKVTDEQFDQMDDARTVRGADIDSILADDGAENSLLQSNEKPIEDVADATLDTPSGSPLEGVSAENGGRDGESGNAAPGSRSGGRANNGRNNGTGVPGPDLFGSEGNGDSEVSTSSTGTGSDSGPRSGGLNAPTTDHTISHELGEGGERAKYRDNIAAIKLLKELEAGERVATKAEQAILAKYVGWGGLKQAFLREDGSTRKGWESAAQELKDVLTEEEYEAARRSTLDAHYTSREVIEGVYAGLDHLGFRQGRVLEPSMGVGNFFGLMPSAMRANSELTGVELDSITGGIAKQLYPHAAVSTPMGFQNFPMTEGYFDVVIGNPPFGSQQIHDRNNRDIAGFSIHNYFFAKSINGLRPGGVLAMVVSNGLLDKISPKQREYMAARAKLLGAIRLPNNAFKKNANTEVTTDIIFLQRLSEGETADTSWTETTDITGGDGSTIRVNNYFAENPGMMLGEMRSEGTMYRAGQAALIAKEGQNTGKLLKDAVKNLPEAAYKAERARTPATSDQVVGKGVESAPVNGFFFDGDALQIRLQDVNGGPRSEPVTHRTNSKGEEVPYQSKELARIKDMVDISRTLSELLRKQISTDTQEGQLKLLRAKLNNQYDKFQKKYGYINARANKSLMGSDPMWPRLAALEHNYDAGVSAAVAKRDGVPARFPSAKKADIFSKRTQSPYSPVSSVSSAKEGLTVSLSELGRVDMGHIQELYSKDESTITKELDGLIFLDPVSGWVTADEYLSGNVKLKLAQATTAAQEDDRYTANIEALKAVIPADIEAADIAVKIGAPWVPGDDLAAFLDHLAGQPTGAKFNYTAPLARWSGNADRVPADLVHKWGAGSKDALELMLLAANNKVPRVTYKDADGNMHTDVEATEAAQQKLNEIKQEFEDWIWNDAGRRERLGRAYNDTYNTTVMRRYDGSHLELSGKVSDDIIKLRPHQKNFVWRVLQSKTALADHVVGAGKTMAMVAAVMELRRTGMLKKPMLVVPNHLVNQWTTEFLELYPNANILVPAKEDFSKLRRKVMFGRIATGDWDAVIVAHSSFTKLPSDREEQQAFIKEQLRDLEESRALLEANEGAKSRSVRDLEKMKETLKEKLEALTDVANQDTDSLSFRELGVDGLFVDEAHEFKNLQFQTTMGRMPGINPSGSAKAGDLFVKTRSVMGRNGRVVFATGTPVSNSMAEMYTMQRYLGYQALKDQGLSHFDAWANVFGEVVTDFELDATGVNYKLNSRFSKFVNMPELMQQYGQFSDTVTRDDINELLKESGGKLPIPKLRTGGPINVIAPRSDALAAYMDTIVDRASNMPKDPRKDNMLKVTGDARKAALDMRLVDPTASDDPTGKVNAAIDNVMEEYRKWGTKKGAQLIFSDLSTPKGAAGREQARINALVKAADQGDEAAQDALDKMSPDELDAASASFSVYDDVRAKLIAKGIPAAEIAFIHDANTDLQKQALFAKVNRGEVRVLLGSTAKMGAGMNAQKRLVALHHLDAPWKPSDLEQREGRIIRQGNELYAEDPENFEISIYRYASEQTYDSRMWQTIEGKARFIEQVRSGNLESREMEDIAGESASAAEMKAAASGNPLILEEFKLRSEIRKLSGLERSHNRKQYGIQDAIRRLENTLDTAPSSITDIQADIRRRDQNTTTNEDGRVVFSAQIGGRSYDKREEAGAKFKLESARFLKSNASELTGAGTLRGFDINFIRVSPLVFEVELQGARRTYYAGKYTLTEVNEAGIMTRLGNVLNGIEKDVAELQERQRRAEAELPSLREQVGAPFKDKEKLAEARKRHAEILKQLTPEKEKKPEGAETQADEDQESGTDTERSRRGTPIATPRPEPLDSPMVAPSAAAKPQQLSSATQGDTWETPHTKTGDMTYMYAPAERLERDAYNKMAATARNHGGRWSRFGKPGFLFKSDKDRQAFLESVGGNSVSESSIGYYHGDSVEARRSRYNPDQADLFSELEGANEEDPYNQAEVRPGTTEAQKEAGRSALRDLFRQLTNRYRRNWDAGETGGAEISLLGAKMFRNFVAGEPNQLIGEKAETPADIAAIAQVYRDPRFETFRFILTKNGRVVGELATTSRMASLVRFADRSGDASNIWKSLKKQMQQLNADGYYMLHNHPSGKSTPSEADLTFTRKIKEEVPGFSAHVVIDHNEYSVINDDLDESTIEAPEFDGIDFASDPEVPNMHLGEVVANPDDLARVGKRLQLNDLAVVIGTDAPGRVALVMSMPTSLLMDAGNNKQRIQKLAALRRISRAAGQGGRVFVVLPESARSEDDSQYTRLVESRIAGFAADVLLPDGTALSSIERMPNAGRKSPVEDSARALSVGENDDSYGGSEGKSDRRQVVGEAKIDREEMNRRMREEHHGIWWKAKTAAKRNLSPGGLLPRVVFNAKIARDSKMGATEMDVQYHVAALERAFKKDFKTSFDNRTVKQARMLRDALAGNPSPDLPQDTAVAIEAMRQYIDRHSAAYVEILREDARRMLDGLPADRRLAILDQLDSGEFDDLKKGEAQIVQKILLMDTIAGNIGEYVHRSYRAFDDPHWARNVPNEVLDNARDYLESRHLEQNPESTIEEAAKAADRIIESILKENTAFDSMEAYIRESKLGAKDLSLLKRRKDIAPEIRELLGEYEDPRLNFAKSATKMTRLIFNDAFLKRVREIGLGTFLFEDGEQPPGHWKTIAAEGNEAYAPLNGLKTTPEINQAFIDALGNENMESWYRAIVRMNGAVKFGKTVLSPTTAARNFMSAMFFTLGNSHFNLGHAGMSLRVHLDKQGDNYDYLRHLKELGVVYDTPYAEEMMRLLRDTDLQDRLLNDRMKAKHALDMAQSFYRFGDDFWKVIGFENEVAIQMKHYGMGRAEAEKEAAERIRNTYPTYSMTGRFVNKLRRFPLAGTFVSFPAEIIRTSYHILRYAKQDMEHSKSLGAQRLAGLAITAGLAYAAQALSMLMLGVDDDEDEAVRQQLPEWSKNSNLYYLSREDGNLRYLDLSFLDPYNYWKRPITAILRDQPLKESAQEAAREMLAPFFGTDIAFGALAEIWSNKKSSGGTVYNSADTALEQSRSIADHIRKAIQPGAFSNLERILKAGRGEKTTTGRTYSMSDEMAALAGFRVSTLDPGVSLKYRSYETQDAIRGASSILRKAATDPNPVSEDELRDAFDRVTEIREEAYQDLLRSITAAKRSGLSDAAVLRQLQSGGLSKKDAAALASGIIPVNVSSKQYLRDAISSAGDTFGPDVQREILKRRSLIMRWQSELLQRQ